MPKPPTFPLILDECSSISIADLNRFGILALGHWWSGNIHWFRGNNEYASVHYFALVSLEPEKAYIEFSFSYFQKPIRWRVPLVYLPSNLGKGHVWFFKCPVTGQRCRKLHWVNGYFMHRSAVLRAYYAQQTYSRRTLICKRLVDVFAVPQHVRKETTRRYFKPTYKGKITRPHARLLRKIERTKRLTIEQIESLDR